MFSPSALSLSERAIRFCGGSRVCGGSERPLGYNEWGLRLVHLIRYGRDSAPHSKWGLARAKITMVGEARIAVCWYASKVHLILNN